MCLLKSFFLFCSLTLVVNETWAASAKFTVYAYLPWKEIEASEGALFKKYGIKSIQVVYENKFLTKGKIDYEKIKKLALDTIKEPSVPVSFDIEVGNKFTAETLIPSIYLILKHYRMYNTKNLIGLYAVIPQNSYGKLISSSSYYKKLNSPYDKLISLVDFISPSLYNYEKNNFNKWLMNAKNIMNVAKSYPLKKPIFPYISPIIRLENLNTIKNGHLVRELSEQEMIQRMEELYKMGASGCIIWASSQDRTQDGQFPQFNPQKGWGKAVVKFIKMHR